jgi:hypothetical protein
VSRTTFDLGARLAQLTVTRAEIVRNPSGGRSIQLRLDEASTTQFAAVTRKLVQHQVAALIEGKVVTAPTVESEISDGDIQISGDDPMITSLAEALHATTRVEPTSSIPTLVPRGMASAGLAACGGVPATLTRGLPQSASPVEAALTARMAAQISGLVGDRGSQLFWAARPHDALVWACAYGGPAPPRKDACPTDPISPFTSSVVTVLADSTGHARALVAASKPRGALSCSPR